MSAIANFTKSLKKWHEDEKGLEALQVVMIIAVAAIALLLVKNNYDTIKSWFETLVKQVTDWTQP